MATTLKKPVILTPSGQALILAPETEQPGTPEEWLKEVEAWRRRNAKVVDRIDVDEFLAWKHSEVEKGLL